jgi:hypothetical protein
MTNDRARRAGVRTARHRRDGMEGPGEEPLKQNWSPREMVITRIGV